MSSPHSHLPQHRSRPSRRVGLTGLSICLVLVAGGGVGSALFQPSSAAARRSNTPYLIRQLSTATDFRVRTQAAFSLGRSRDASARAALERAMQRDTSPAVRAAAATALGQLGDRRSVAALRRARRDASASVRRQAEASLAAISRGSRGSGTEASPTTPRRVNWRRARYAIVVGDVSNRASFGGPAFAAAARSALMTHLGEVQGVVPFATAGAVDGDAQRQIRRHHLRRFRFDASITSFDETERHGETRVRVAVNVMMLADPGRALRGMLTGAASSVERTQRNRRTQRQRMAAAAVDAAVRSALSDARRALDDAR